LHLPAPIANFLCREQVTLGDGYVKPPLRVENSFVTIPTGSGLGVELDESALADKLS
jgi:galactonate dehydratase